MNSNNDAKVSEICNYPLSTTRVPIVPQYCGICLKDKGQGTRRKFKTAWSLAWHLSHFHKGEQGFQDENERIRKIFKQSLTGL